mgnify:CR=1 FL=1
MVLEGPPAQLRERPEAEAVQVVAAGVGREGESEVQLATAVFPAIVTVAVVVGILLLLVSY